jgi:iron(II)-dependent oxidoreductase
MNVQLLNAFTQLHELLYALLRERTHLPTASTVIAGQPSLAWYFGYCVYLELYWLRERLNGDSDLTDSIRELFSDGSLSLEERCARLPSPEHLFYWGKEIHDEHIRRLATPTVQSHPLLADQRLAWFLVQEQAKCYERMIARCLAEQIMHQQPYHVTTPLAVQSLDWPLQLIDQGHYRIGSRYEPQAYDNELPPQAVELASYRITQQPVSNGQFLAFMQAGGYTDQSLWCCHDEHDQKHVACPWPLNWEGPVHWQRDTTGQWYGVGLNGAADLVMEAPVTGLSYYEAHAFVTWLARTDPDHYKGACLPHEYQWEVAARRGYLEHLGNTWEWCSNRLHPYPEFKPIFTTSEFPANTQVLRGACLHTRSWLRRPSFRQWAAPQDRFVFAGLRFILPPS